MLLDLLRLECAGSGKQNEACIGVRPRQEGAMKREEKKVIKKVKYEKPVLVKQGKLTAIIGFTF